MAQISRRHFIHLLGTGAGAASLGLLAGCAPSAQPASGGSGSEGPSGAPGARSEGGGVDRSGDTFSLASWSLNEEASKEIIEAMIADYSEAAGVTVNPISFPYNEYLNQLTLQVRGGQFTGLAQLDIAWLGAMAALGQLRDLTDATEGAGYTESALASGQVDGRQLGLPWTTGAIGLVGNSEILEAAGVTSAPTTIDEFDQALQAVKAANPDIVPYAASTKVEQLKDVLVWMQTFGSPLLAGDTTTIGDDASIEAVTWYQSLYDRGLIAPAVDRFDARALFSQAGTALYDDAIVGKGAVTSESPDPDLAAKMVPWSRPVLTAGDDPRALLWGHLLVVVDGEGSDAAAEMARTFTADPAVTVPYFEALGLPPTTTEALEHPAVTGDEYTTAFTERITATATPNPFWKYPEYAQMEAAVAEQVQAVLVGQASPADAMRAAGEEIQGLIG